MVFTMNIKTTSGTLAYVGSGSQTVSGAGITDFGIQASLGSFVVATGGTQNVCVLTLTAT